VVAKGRGWKSGDPSLLTAPFYQLCKRSREIVFEKGYVCGHSERGLQHS